MTARDGFELLVTSWLDDAGPRDVDDAVVERALASAARTGQRHGIVAALAGPSPWPRSHPAPLDLRLAVRLAIALALVAATVAGAVFIGSRRHDSPARPTGTVTTVQGPTVARSGAVLVRLRDGRVAVAGGVEIGAAPVELLDPSSGRFASRAALDLPGGGTGFELPDGTVLFVMFDGNSVRAYAQVVNVQTDEVVALPATATLHLRGPAAARLADGRILFAGGDATQDLAPPYDMPIAAAEVFSPSTNRFAATGAMHETRFGHSAAPLPDGRVLVAGGDGRADAEIFDPVSATFGDPIPMASVRAETIAVPLPNGTVVVFRGGLASLNPDAPATDTPVDIFDPLTNTFRAAARVPFEPTAAAVLADGRVFLTTDQGGLVYDPASGATARTDVRASNVASVVTLADGGVLVLESSGIDEAGLRIPNATEIFRP